MSKGMCSVVSCLFVFFIQFRDNIELTKDSNQLLQQCHLPQNKFFFCPSHRLTGGNSKNNDNFNTNEQNMMRQNMTFLIGKAL